MEIYRNANDDTLLCRLLPFFVKETRWVPARYSGASKPTVLQYILIEQTAEHSISNESKAELEELAHVADLIGSEERQSVPFFRSDPTIVSIFLKVGRRRWAARPFPLFRENLS